MMWEGEMGGEDEKKMVKDYVEVAEEVVVNNSDGGDNNHDDTGKMEDVSISLEDTSGLWVAEAREDMDR
eukprot:2194486-Karenia_brevis.AAC.1